VTTQVTIPGPNASELDWLLFEQEGILSSGQATALLGRGKLRSAITGRRWRHLCTGVIATHNGPLTVGQTHWAAVLASGRGSVLAGRTAAHAGGLLLGEPGPIHLLVPHDRRYSDRRRQLPPDMPPVVVHRTTHLPEHDLQRGRPTRTTMPRSVIDAASWAASDEQARVIVAAACQQGLVTADEIRAVAADMLRAPRRALVLETVNDAEGGATTLPEIEFSRLLRRHRLPAPQLQYRREDATGRVRYLDAYWRPWRLHAEIDGGHHLDAQHWEADMRRQNDVWIAGDRILRFSSWQIRHEAHHVAAQVRAALEAAGWRADDAQPPH
jgi:very-short-patch-repair endonuclease